MNPDKSSPGGDMQTPSNGGTSHDTSVSATPEQLHAQQIAAANLIRTQIDGLFEDPQAATKHEPTPKPKAAPAPQQTDTNVYHRNHAQHPLPEAEQWKEYHSAWQTYYQKYYENYYTAQAVAEPVTQKPSQAQTHAGYFSHQTDDETPATAEAISNDEALYELRQKLLGRVQSSASKIRKSRHFIPVLSAVGVVLLFVFIQYNQVFIANVKAYVSPGAIDPQNIVVDPSTDVVVTKEPRLIIPKINVDVPVAYDVGTDNDSQMAAMENGLAHFPIAGASSHPGEIGNTVLAGHSSNDLFDVGDYKFIFAQLEKLNVGDSIYANYNGKRYTYVVTKTEVVKPTEVNRLVYQTNKPVMTLITCTPLGTALNRLLVTAEQVSPDPSAATAAPKDTKTPSTTTIPGNSGTLFEKLFGKK